ncbi:MAG TPA: uracil-DNA glycosylase [Sphingobium sp.]|nr:uracil-DNA glycosylase [Sphingobium sp.]
MTLQSPIADAEAPLDCPLCPRLVALRQECRAQHPDWWNAPVPAFGDALGRIVVVGLAPGKQGANRTGRAFTGDFAGDLLFGTLLKTGLAEGRYRDKLDDQLTLRDVILLNAVKCLPPQNKPLPQEAHNCRIFLKSAADALPNAQIFIALGEVAHQSIVKVLGGKLPKARFAHMAEHRMPSGKIVIDSYHCSKRNIMTGRLTNEMLDAVFERAMSLLQA